MSLELVGKATGNVRRYGAKADKTNDGKTAVAFIDLKLDEEQAKALGGKLFASTCFSDFAGKSAAATATAKKLGGELKIKAEHTIDVGSYKLTTKPKITNLALSDKERSVTLTIRIEIPGASKKLRQQLDAGVGDDIDLDFLGAAQPDLVPDDGDVAHGGSKKAKRQAVQAAGNGHDADATAEA